ncbi:unnamed protein product [Linum trigynum]|uniref:Uncharacterized protein n=1 Tax=Linum trigynum TaxID=586398 RepID=A0AAV2ED15_9ROSI
MATTEEHWSPFGKWRRRAEEAGRGLAVTEGIGWLAGGGDGGGSRLSSSRDGKRQRQGAAAGGRQCRQEALGSSLHSWISASRCVEEIEGLRVYSAASIRVEALGRILDTAASFCLRQDSCAG